MPIVWTCKFNRTWIIKQSLQYKWSNKVTFGFLRKPRCSCAVGWYQQRHVQEYSSPWRVPVEKQQQPPTVSKCNSQFWINVYIYGSPEFQFIFCRQEESWVIDEISPQSPTAAKFNASQKKTPEMSRQYAFLRDRPSTFPIFYTKIEFFSYIFIEY